MSRVEDMLAEFAPDGVVYRRLGELCAVFSGHSFKSKLFNTEKIGLPLIRIRDVNTGVSGTYYSGEYDNRFVVNDGDLLIGMDGDFRAIWWSEGTALLNQRVCRLQDFAEFMEPKFMFYYVQDELDRIHARIQASTVKHLSSRDLAASEISVPPLEVQREIVRILDQFTQLEAELEAELEARRQQYEHYRAKLLTPEPGWRETTLGEIAEVFDGPHATPKKTSAGPWYLSISSLNDGNVDLTTSAHLAVEDLPKWTRRVAPQHGDTLFSYETRIGQAAYWDRHEAAALGRRMGILRPVSTELVPKFLTYAYLGPGFQAVIASKMVRGSTVDRISIADLPNWPIAVPSVDEQHRIVQLLMKFDALVNDLRIGLPAELAARRKQYEYYRDRLLTFEEAPA